MKRFQFRNAAFASLAALPIAALMFSGCGGGSSGQTTPPGSAGTSTATIPTSGGQIQLANVAEATFPNGAFASPLRVTLSRQDLGALPDAFEDSVSINSIKRRSAYQVILTLGNSVPRSNTFDLTLNIPDSFLSQVQSNESIRAFARVTQQDELEVLDSYEVVPATYDAASKKLTIQFNKAWLTKVHNSNDAYEAVVAIITIPGVASQNATRWANALTQQANTGSCGAKALGSPLTGTPELSGNPPRGFNPIPTTHPVNGTQSSHWGSDLKAAQGSPVLAAEDGVIERVKFSGAPSTWPVYPNGGSGGQYIVVRHPDGSKTKYMHLSGVSVSEKTPVPVTKGQQIGLSGGTRGTPGAGGSTGPHLHFEYSPNGQIYNNDTTSKTDPFPCVTTSDATGSILVNDNGPANDDVFEVKVDGIVLGRTPKGGSDTFGLNNLRPGTKTLSITCLDDGADGTDAGTLGVALNDGVTFEGGGTTASAEVAQGATVTYRIVVPSASRSQASVARRAELPKNPHPTQGK